MVQVNHNGPGSYGPGAAGPGPQVEAKISKKRACTPI